MKNWLIKNPDNLTGCTSLANAFLTNAIINKLMLNHSIKNYNIMYVAKLDIILHAIKVVFIHYFSYVQ